MKKWSFLILILIVAALIPACQKSRHPQKPQILVSIPSYEKLLQSAVGNHYEVICVVPEGFNPHYFEVRPNDLNKIQNPKFWFGINESFEPKLLQTLQSRFKDLQYYNLIQSVSFDKIIDHGQCHHHEHEEDHDHEDEIDMIDNHVWMSPKLLQKQFDFIKKTIPNLSNEESIAFANLNDTLAKLDKKLSINLLPCQGKSLLVSHASFGYFCKEYDIYQIPIECEGKQPMPKDLENLATRLKNTDIICVLAQVQFDQKGAILIAKKLHKPLYSIDPYSKNYFEMMEDLQDKLTKKP